MLKSALEHSCEKYGCARKCLDPKLRVFDDCFGGLIRMGDVDGAVERNGHILWLEWKRGAVLDAFEKQHYAQLRLAKAFTANSNRQTFVFVIGCPVNMSVERFRILKAGGWWTREWLEGDTERFRRFLRHWFSEANRKAGAA